MPATAAGETSSKQHAGAERHGTEKRAGDNPNRLVAVTVVHAVADGDEVGADAEIDEPRRVESAGEQHREGEAGDGARGERPAEPAPVEAQEVLRQKPKADSPAGRERLSRRGLCDAPAAPGGRR